MSTDDRDDVYARGYACIRASEELLNRLAAGRRRLERQLELARARLADSRQGLDEGRKRDEVVTPSDLEPSA